ncbi:MAG: hypothetical protein ACLFPW_13770 [Spirochaetaceae bacterium]
MPSRSTPTLFSPQLIFVLTILAGTLGWEVLVSLLALGGLELPLSTGPVGFDVKVISFYMEVNPGTFLGLFLGYRFARSVSGSKGASRRSGRSKPAGTRGKSSKSGSTGGSAPSGGSGSKAGSSSAAASGGRASGGRSSGPRSGADSAASGGRSSD